MFYAAAGAARTAAVALGAGVASGNTGPFLVLGLKHVHPRSAMDRLRGVWISQDQRPEECTKASELAMVVMD